MEKLEELEAELKDLETKLEHMATEFTETRGGSAYGVEYYDIQVRVYQEMVAGVKKEIQKEKARKRAVKAS